MSDFINTIDALGDDVVMDSIIDRTITEFKDDVITNVGVGAFYNCVALTSVSMPNVTQIRATAFYRCVALTSVNTPNLELIDGTSAFYGCTGLSDVYMPKLSVLPMSTFYNSGLVSARFPLAGAVSTEAFYANANLISVDLPVCTIISAKAFFQSAKFTTLILRSATMCTLDNVNAFEAGWEGGWTNIKRGTGYIYVPAALVDSYKAATNWSTYADQFRALEDYTVDGTTAGELDESKI